MGVFRRVLDWLQFADVPETRRQFDSAPRPIDVMVGEMLGHGASPRVGRIEALSVPAVQRARNLICSISTLPLVQLDSMNEPVRLPLLEQVDPDVPNVVTMAQTVEDLLFEGVAWWRITERDSTGYPTSARHLDVGSVSINPPASTQSPAPLPAGHDPRGAVLYVDGKPVAARELIRFDSPNPAVLVVGGRAIRRALLLDQVARMYADNPRPLDFFSPADSASTDPVTDDQIAEILSMWKAERKKRGTAYVPAALKYNSVDSPSPADLQLVELQKQATLDIANAMGLDPEDLGISTTSRTYQNTIDRRQDRINDVLSPFMRALTDRLSMGDVTRRGYRVTFNLDDYLRADPKTRWEVYQIANGMGALEVAEIRKEEGLPPLAAPVAPTATVTPIRPAIAANMPAARTFDQPAHTFVDMPVHQFRVDREKRTIEGLALPYGSIAAKYWRKYRFEPGALKFGELSRIKLLRDHDYSQALGVLVAADDREDGMFVKYKVARGLEGDRALELAEDGVLDGFSVGVDFDDATDTVPDPQNKGVTLVRRADWRETSLTAMPAFDDARVTKVAASRTQGETMPETEPATAPVAPASVPVDFGAALAAFMTQHAPVAPAAPEGPTFVNPVRTVAATQVNEAAPYRFDRRGNLMPGAHDFSRDLIAGLRDGDQVAHERAMEFVRQQFDVITTDINELNPTRQRPDMYVDERSFRYPLWERVNKGTLSDITPFVFPKFSSAGTLVGAHTEGTEPSSGTFVTTSATVTPTALSGKAKISREVWDQGGNPQVSNLIWRQMVKGWFEALEAAVVTMLDAASPTQIDFSGTPGLADDDLDQAITQAFAALQFVRGGFSMDVLATQIDLYKKLIAATDADGRRLYPALGPANAMGTVARRFATLDINGVEAIPVWALAATGTVSASSYLFDSASVHMWASSPQRLTIDRTEVANVYIGLFGYKAGVIADLNGVREIVYDPA